MKYTLTFQDGTSYTQTDLNKSGWLQIPDKPISKLEYELNGYLLVAENFKAYYHLKNRSSVVKISGKAVRVQNDIVSVTIGLQKKDSTIFVIFDLKDNIIREKSVNKIFNDKGWKLGTDCNSPFYRKIKL
jgi:hypothetical protein